MAKNSEKHSPYFNLKDAFKENHCPFCFLARKSVTRYFDHLLYERVNDPGIRDTLRKSRGFCQKHYWQLAEFGDGFGISIFEKDVLSVIASEWKKEPRVVGKEKKLKATCPACSIWNQTEESYINLFIEHLDDFSLTFESEHSFGFCLDHFKEMIQKVENETKRSQLLEIELRKMESLIKELEEFCRKHDYRFSKEGFGKEGDAWIRVIEFLKGKSNLLRDLDEFKRKI